MVDHDLSENYAFCAPLGRQRLHLLGLQNIPRTRLFRLGIFLQTISHTLQTKICQTPRFCLTLESMCFSCFPGVGRFLGFLFCCLLGCRQCGLSHISGLRCNAFSKLFDAHKMSAAGMSRIGDRSDHECKALLSRRSLHSICLAFFDSHRQKSNEASNTASQFQARSAAVDGGYQCLVEA